MEGLEVSAQNELSIRFPNRGKKRMGVRSMTELWGTAGTEQKPNWAHSHVCMQIEGQGLLFLMGSSLPLVP